MYLDNENLPSDESFDDVIRVSLFLGTDEHRLRRLERFWHMQSRRQTRLRQVLIALPLAAAALSAVALGALEWNRHKGAESALAIRNMLPRTNNSDLIDTDTTDRTPIEQSHLAGRPPTGYERFVFAARTSAQISATTMSVTIDEAIIRLRLNPESNAKQMIDSPGFERDFAEVLLLRRLPRSNNEDQRAIVRLLAVCGTPRSTPVLLRLVRQAALREEALRTIEQIVGIENLAELVRNTDDKRVRSALMRRLLTTDTEPALIGYLSLLRDDGTRDEALALAVEMPQIPIATFVGLLDYKEESVRLSAAILLGHLNNAEVTQQLITRLTKKPSDSTEAWMALMACHDELAGRFLAYATERPQLLGHFNTARVRWAQMIP